MDCHGGRVCPRAAGAAERSRRRARHGGAGQVGYLFVICHGGGDAPADSQNSRTRRVPASPCLLCTLTKAPCAILPVDHGIATIDVVAAIEHRFSKKRAALSNLFPPPAGTNAAPRRALPFSADPRDRDRSAGCARRPMSVVIRLFVFAMRAFGVCHVCPCAAFGPLPLFSPSPCSSRYTGDRRSPNAAVRKRRMRLSPIAAHPPRRPRRRMAPRLLPGHQVRRGS